MIVVKSLSETDQISNSVIRDLVRQRIDDLGGDSFDTTELGYFLVGEAGVDWSNPHYSPQRRALPVLV